MSIKITEIQASDGAKIYMQYEEGDREQLQAVGFFEDIEERTKNFQAGVTNIVNEYAQLLLTSIKQGVSQANPPSKVTLEFGLQVGGETGIPLVTKGSAQANIKAAIEWKFNQDKGG